MKMHVGLLVLCALVATVSAGGLHGNLRQKMAQKVAQKVPDAIQDAFDAQMVDFMQMPMSLYGGSDPTYDVDVCDEDPWCAYTLDADVVATFAPDEDDTNTCEPGEAVDLEVEVDDDDDDNDDKRPGASADRPAGGSEPAKRPITKVVSNRVIGAAPKTQ